MYLQFLKDNREKIIEDIKSGLKKEKSDKVKLSESMDFFKTHYLAYGDYVGALLYTQFHTYNLHNSRK